MNRPIVSDLGKQHNREERPLITPRVDHLLSGEWAVGWGIVSDHPSPAILFFDGTCNLCNGFVRFVLDRDARARFRFASLQSDYAQRFFADHAWDAEGLDSVVLFKEDRFYVMSDAALEITKDLSGVWSWFHIFRFLPKRFRDTVYRWIAAHRYRLFGRRDECRLPTPAEAPRFLS